MTPAPDSMVERVKAAMLKAYWSPGIGWEDRCARAAIEAMRNPTDAMAIHGCVHLPVDTPAAAITPQMGIDVYQAMIAKALS